ncbi:MAG: mannonate dehydratase [Candidatus Didemnitutus sp.]|nr:mannonate dehydratase [Candidatus Didemnitutus sp.]
MVKTDPHWTRLPPPSEIDTLRTIQRELAEAGLTLIGLEGDPIDMTRIKLGLPGRDEDIATYRKMLRNMGELGLRLLCYNFMAGIGWHRSDAGVPGRGGALVSRLDLAQMPATLTEHGEISAERIWDNYVHFLRAILPAAEAAGVRLGAHPDDPPVPSLRGLGRIFHAPEQFQRALGLSASPAHGLTFCQANWKLMGGPDGAETQRRLAANIEHFTRTGRVHFVHLRDVVGDARSFTETFHDEGPTDFPAMLQLYHTAGFRGPVRCDHVPTMAGEPNDQPGYGTLGRLFADGYLLGLMDALDVRTSPEEWLHTP